MMHASSSGHTPKEPRPTFRLLVRFMAVMLLLSACTPSASTGAVPQTGANSNAIAPVAVMATATEGEGNQTPDETAEPTKTNENETAGSNETTNSNETEATKAPNEQQGNSSASNETEATKAPDEQQGNSSANTANGQVASVTVNDQAIQNGTVTVARVFSPGPGWMTIHAEANDNIGPVIGYTAVKPGENDNVVVQINVAQATKTMYAMLHQDAGKVGVYEFPGPDTPVMVNGAMVSPDFSVSNLENASSSGSSQLPEEVKLEVSSNPQLGNILTDDNGKTLYTFTKDTPGVSNCTGNCAQAWPPLLVAQGGKAKIDDAYENNVGVIVRADGATQVTYRGMPLYYYSADTNPGQVNGQGVGSAWYVVKP
jgi:predicted lipoprotein with Yx(FWY)xxD motif